MTWANELINFEIKIYSRRLARKVKAGRITGIKYDEYAGKFQLEIDNKIYTSIWFNQNNFNSLKTKELCYLNDFTIYIYVYRRRI